MEVELVTVASLPLGLVSSTLLHGADSKPEEQPTPQAAGVLVALCSTGRLVAFIAAYKAQFVVADAPLFHKGQLSEGVSYRTSYEGLLQVVRAPSQPRPTATTVIVIPIAFERSGATQQSSIVVVGFSDGHIRGYSKSGVCVLSQCLHSEPISRLTCMTPLSKTTPTQSSLVVLLKGVVCVVEGGSLVEVVRANVAALTHEGGGGVGGAGSNEEGHPLSLAYRKWHLLDQSSTVDLALLAHSTPSAYDHLCEASSVGGFDTVIRTGPTPEARLITVGTQPMIALYKITKDAGQLNMSEVVSAVASKMTTAVLGKLSQASGWLGWSTSVPKPKQAEEKVQLSANLPMSTNIPDVRRSVVSLTESPLGNLAAAVDEFGRVLLVDCEELIIKRMWKGYREAQCGWLLVQETTPFVSTATRGRKRDNSTRTKPGRVKRAQCLCIYAPRRGIVELWPVVFGGRVAAFQVGKGCRLLYSPHGVFSVASQQSGGAVPDRDGGTAGGVRETVLLLSPSGQLVSFSVPFASLVSLSDPSSHDNHLLKRLSEALTKGDSSTVLHAFAAIKSAGAVKQAVDVLIGAHPHQGVPGEFIVKCLNCTLSRMDTNEPALQNLLHYVSGVRQLVQLSLALEGVVCDTKPHPFPAKLEQLLSVNCGLPEEQSKRISTLLESYFAKFQPQKRVIKKLELKDLIRCVELPRKVGGFILPSITEKQRPLPPSQPQLLLKESLSETDLLDLACLVFTPLIMMDLAAHDVESLIQKSGFPAKTLLSLLCRAFLSASYSECNPSVLLLHLEKAITAVTKLPSPPSPPSPAVEEEEAELWSDVGLQCSHTHCVGHALLLTLLSGQTHSTNTDSSSAGTAVEGEESWETVSAEREIWIRLTHSLEALTSLSNVIGQSSMKLLPPAPWLAEEEGRGVRGEGGEGVEVLDVSGVEIQLMSETHKSGVCVASLSLFGPSLITHCLAAWLLPQAPQLPAELIAHLPSDPHQATGGHAKLVFQLSPLLRLLPRSCSHDALLLSCAWQAGVKVQPGVKVHESARLLLDYLSHLSSPQLLTGAVCLFWHQLFEGTVVKAIDSLRRGSRVEPGSAETVSVCRNLFGYLFQLTGNQDADSEVDRNTATSDILKIDKPAGTHGLMELVQAFPRLSPTVVRLYFELLLLLETALPLQSPLNAVVFFSSWLRGALKRGVFQCPGPRHEQIPAQLQQKRAKFLCEAVSVYLSQRSNPKMAGTVPSAAITRPTAMMSPPSSSSSSSSSSSVEVVEFEDFVFLLAELWRVDVDGVRKHWTACFFAAGLGERGREVFQCVKDKRKVSHDLLAVAGCLADHLIHSIDSKPDRLALLAQTPPSLLEWLRKQGSGNVGRGFQRVEPSWLSLSQLMAVTQPYHSGSPSDATMAGELGKLIAIRTQ